MLEEMSRNLEVLHVGFLIYMTGHTSKRQMAGTWRIESEAKVLKEVGTQTLGEYVEKCQATVV